VRRVRWIEHEGYAFVSIRLAGDAREAFVERQRRRSSQYDAVLVDGEPMLALFSPLELGPHRAAARPSPAHGVGSGRDATILLDARRHRELRILLMATFSAPIVPPEAVRSLVPSVRVLDCRTGPGARERYEAEHLHGALFCDLEHDLAAHTDDASRGGRHPLPDVEAWSRTLGRWGIDPQTPVLLYDDKGGTNAAARAWWMLRASGHEDVAVLDGGWQGAQREGLPIDAEHVEVDPKPPYPVHAWQRPTVDIEEVAALTLDPSRKLIDVRAAERYRGDSETIDPVAGHIPGAHNIPLTYSLLSDGRFASPDELRAHFETRLGVPIENVVVSCGSGVTACHTLLALEHAGLKGAALYVGSWSEWCRQDREQARGPSPR
jgi:thiosulfate/3-mercaptopyruvate sulfurtransferase